MKQNINIDSTSTALAGRNLLQFMLRAQHITQRDGRSDEGYAMMLVSIVSVLIFSLLGAFLTMTNLSRSSTNAYVDGNNSFYAAESGLNRRAEDLRQKFIGYATPSGLSPGQVSTASVVTPANMVNCFALGTTSIVTTNDFECRNYSFRYNNNAATVKNGDGDIVISDKDNNSNSINYTAYTFVADRTNYVLGSVPKVPVATVIPAGQNYAGLNAQEYHYTVYAIATKAGQVQGNDAKTVLQMDFRSEIIPLFQFAAFYNGDLEINSTSRMILSGRVHTNSNFYIQPTSASNAANLGTSIESPTTVVGDIYNRVDASTNTQTGITSILLTGASDPNPTSPSYGFFPLTDLGGAAATDPPAGRITPLTQTELSAFNNKVLDGNGGNPVQKLNPPKAGFLRKKNYLTNEIGEYYGKADLRLEMYPKRAIPFDFTAIQNTAAAQGGSCTAAFNVPANRQGSNLKCRKFTKGQLQSLRQPVLVRTKQNQAAGLQAEELAFNPTTSTIALSAGANNDTTKASIVKALQAAIVSTPDPIALDRMAVQFSSATGSLATTKTTFATLLGSIAGLSATDIANLTAASPNDISALNNSWFLAAPIQMVKQSKGLDLTNNPDNSGFYDGREQRWITMLQTNILSLTVWNRDGIYVEANDTDLTTAYAAPTTWTLANAIDANGMLFTRAAAATVDKNGVTLATGDLRRLGLASNDTTEGGLVYHATVSDDLDGNGTDDVSAPATTANAIKDNAGNTIDYYRIYPGSTLARRSPYGFVFNDANNLPGAMTIATDRAAYIQGDFNNFGGAAQPNNAPYTPSTTRQSASILADTITILSNDCLSNDSAISATNVMGVPAGQIKCGIPNPNINTNIGAETPAIPQFYLVNSATAVNAAFLSNTEKSNGNLGIGRNDGTGKRYSGGLNNYIRMVENWNFLYFNYSGSFVSLGTPLEYSGNYNGGGSATSYYNIPSRNFNYETNFNSFNNLPPLSPNAIYLQQEVFKRSYN